MDLGPMAQHPILSIQQVAEFYGIDRKVIADWIQQGKLTVQTLPDGSPGIPIDVLNYFLRTQGILTPREPSERLKVLIVDDEALISRVLRKALSQAWPTAMIEEAITGFEAGRKMMQLLPDVMVLDIALPGVDGHDVLAAVRLEPRLSHTIVIAITAYDTPEMRQRMMEHGARVFLAKPFDPTELVSAMGELLAAKKADEI